MTKYVEVAITTCHNILVEVLDDSDESLNWALDVAHEQIDGDIAESEIISIFDERPEAVYSFDAIVELEAEDE